MRLPVFVEGFGDNFFALDRFPFAFPICLTDFVPGADFLTAFVLTALDLAALDFLAAADLDFFLTLAFVTPC